MRASGEYAQEADPVLGICGAHGRYESTEVRGVRRTGGGRGLRGGGNPGRRRMAQDGGTRSGAFHGGMDHYCRESQGRTTACSSSMPEHDRKDQARRG